jgi:hypothetical protein
MCATRFLLPTYGQPTERRSGWLIPFETLECWGVISLKKEKKLFGMIKALTSSAFIVDTIATIFL